MTVGYILPSSSIIFVLWTLVLLAAHCCSFACIRTSFATFGLAPLFCYFPLPTLCLGEYGHVVMNEFHYGEHYLITMFCDSAVFINHFCLNKQTHWKIIYTRNTMEFLGAFTLLLLLLLSLSCIWRFNLLLYLILNSLMFVLLLMPTCVCVVK